MRTAILIVMLEPRLGLNIPYEWWPSAATLKGLEAAGFAWVQIAAPPVEMLADARHAVRHAAAMRRSLDVTSLKTVVHGPTNLQLGSALHHRAFEGLLEYTKTIGATHVVYHALDFPRRGTPSEDEEHALRRLGGLAEALRVTVCLENLCPVYPGRSSICHDPLAIRDLVRRLDMPAFGMLLDVGHAHVVAGFMGVETAALVSPVLDEVRLFHVHDNWGARLGGEGNAAIDPLQLDLHLPPGSGTLPWDHVRAELAAHDAPLMMEIHPAHKLAPAELWAAAMRSLGGEPASIRASSVPRDGAETASSPHAPVRARAGGA